MYCCSGEPEIIEELLFGESQHTLLNKRWLVRIPNYNFKVFDRISAVAFPNWEFLDEWLTTKEYLYTFIVNPVIYRSTEFTTYSLFGDT